jgi:galactose mutarotase-like enzyme
MKFSHREEQWQDRQLDVLTDEENGLRLVVSRLGAELISLAQIDATGKWIGFLYRDKEIGSPQSGWANHATVMGYYLHRLKDGRSLYRGHEIKGGNHSFLRTKTWRLIDGNEQALTYRITPDDFDETEYPLRVSVDLTYQIDGGKVVVEFAFHNHEPELTAHLEFGLHPGFGATGFDTFHLQMPPGLYRRHFSPGNYLSGETRDMEVAAGEMPWPRSELPGSIILEFIDVPLREFSFVDPLSGRWMTVDLAGVPYVTLWSDGGPFLCIEPCWGLTDHHQQRPFEKKEGIQTIPPKTELRASFSMSPQLASSD